MQNKIAKTTCAGMTDTRYLPERNSRLQNGIKFPDLTDVQMFSYAKYGSSISPTPLSLDSFFYIFVP